MQRHRVQEHLGVAVFTPEESVSILVGLLVTWGLGLLPAWVARYRWKKAPLSKRSANWIAGLSCLFFAIVFLVLKGILGEVNPRMSPAWVLVFFAQRWIMTHGSKSDEELVTGLCAMIADPATAEDRRQLAREKLARLEAKVRKLAPPQTLATVGGPQLIERVEPAGHPLRAAKSTLDHGDPAEQGEPRVRLPRRGKPQPESWRRYGRLAAYMAGIVVALDILLMVSGYRVLIYEKVVEPGESYVTERGTFSHNERTFIVCRYWTGRNLKIWVSWYGFENGEVDECRLLFDPGEGA